MIIGVCLFIIIVLVVIIIRRKNLIIKYVQDNSQYYDSLMKIKRKYGLIDLATDHLVSVDEFINGNRREFNKYLESRPQNAVYRAILNRNGSAFMVYTQWRNEIESISKFKSDWKEYVQSHNSNRWEDMKPNMRGVIFVSARHLYKLEARLIMSELEIAKPSFRLDFNVEYVSPGGRDTHHWKKTYYDYDFSEIANIWHNSTHTEVIEKPKGQLALPLIDNKESQQKKNDEHFQMDYINRKYKAQVQARVDRVLEYQKGFEAELTYNNETLKLAESFDELLREYSKSLAHELSETKVSIALTQLNPDLEFVRFKKRFRKFREHSILVRKSFYNKMRVRYKNHQADVIRFTKMMNVSIDEINHSAFDYVQLLVKDYKYGSKKDLSFCDADSIAKLVRSEFDKQKIRYGASFTDGSQESSVSPKQELAPLDAETYDALMENVDFPDQQGVEYVQGMPDAVATYETVSNTPSKVLDNVIQMKPVAGETATARWEHEFDDYDFDVNCEFRGIPYKDEAYRQLVENEAYRLGIDVGILSRMRFYNLSQYLMLKSSHMLQESITADQPMVYIIYNKSKDLVYVGQASQGFAKRFDEHLHSYHNNIAHNGSSTTGSYLWNRDLLAGDDIYFSFITVNNDSNNPGYLTMDSLENAFIHILHSNQKEYGYNQKSGNGFLQKANAQVINY